jgi:hypothetical protein
MVLPTWADAAFVSIPDVLGWSRFDFGAIGLIESEKAVSQACR